jgi:hypothetical protein
MDIDGCEMDAYGCVWMWVSQREKYVDIEPTNSTLRHN